MGGQDGSELEIAGLPLPPGSEAQTADNFWCDSTWP
jgi:hypothetical protein